MKKILSLIFLILTIQLCGCENSGICREIEKINFNQAMGEYSIDITKGKDSILLFAIANDLSEEDFNTLAGSNIEITLISADNEKVILKSPNIEWQQCDPNLLTKGISLRLTFDNTKELKSKIINRIVFSLEKKRIKFKINPIYLNTYTSEDNGISVMEAPIAPQQKMNINTEYTYSYKILDQDGKLTNDLQAELTYNKDLKEFINITKLDISRDQNTENQIKEEYKDTISKEKLVNIRVYEIKCSYEIKKKSNIVFQPRIILHYLGNEQYVAPFEPICFFYEENK